MAHGSADDEIVTTFLLNTCEVRRCKNYDAMHSLSACFRFATLRLSPPDYDEMTITVVPAMTGSTAEFYIQPMLSCVGDADIMCHRIDELAIPEGTAPPTQLPEEFDSCVKVYEIVDYEFPGYVYLVLSYFLTECIDDGTYNVIECQSMYKRYSAQVNAEERHGPAIVDRWLGTTKPFCRRLAGSRFSRDTVCCVRCLSWPLQAADWPIRQRQYGWPDSATVDHIVSYGCDVVQVAHRLCRPDKWMLRAQWRLSFSRAEVVLLNSWMPVQQIIYHMLRVFVKVERLTDGAKNSDAATLSNYNIKTLMLWACELKPIIWWTDDLSLVGICVELLYDLAVWLTEARCPSYFIKNCNLVDSSFNLVNIRNQLMSITRSWLSSWFVNNYIRRCSQLCPHIVSRLFKDISASPVKLQNAILAIVDWKLQNWHTLKDRWYMFAVFAYIMSYFVTHFGLTVWSIDCLSTELRKISTCLHDVSLSVVFLHAACRTTRIGLDDEMMDVLSVVLGQLVGPRRYSNRRSSVLFLSKAANLMKAVDDRHKSRSTAQLIEIELSKVYLHRALSCEDSESDSVYCLANVYLAILYYTTGQYQMAIDHCTQVIKPRDHSQCSSHVVQGELLPKTDDDIDIALGLAVFYQHVRTAALNQRQQTYVTVFTTELFAHYLHIKCLSVTKCQQLSDTTYSQSSTCEVQLMYITDTQQLFITDVLLWKFVNGFYGHTFVSMQQTISGQYPTKYPSELNTSNLVELLHTSAVEHLTTFRQIEAQEFSSV